MISPGDFELTLNKILQTNGKPDCFPSVEAFKSWSEHENVAHTKDFRKDICEDCTVKFRLRMIQEGKCLKSLLLKNFTS